MIVGMRYEHSRKFSRFNLPIVLIKMSALIHKMRRGGVGRGKKHASMRNTDILFLKIESMFVFNNFSIVPCLGALGSRFLVYGIIGRNYHGEIFI